MAKNKGTVYLGFEDEFISDKYKCSLNYLVNKVGGLPVSRICRGLFSTLHKYWRM